PQSTLFCVLSSSEVLMSPGAVLEVASRGAGEDVARCRQLRQNFLPMCRCLSPGKVVATGLCF
ncbi:hypothetical protein A2U01_0099106, partial [Trifolium medium]|nr:hypothetical protein [Trifolium medium]